MRNELEIMTQKRDELATALKNANTLITLLERDHDELFSKYCCLEEELHVLNMKELVEKMEGPRKTPSWDTPIHLVAEGEPVSPMVITGMNEDLDLSPDCTVKTKEPEKAGDVGAYPGELKPRVRVVGGRTIRTGPLPPFKFSPKFDPYDEAVRSFSEKPVEIAKPPKKAAKNNMQLASDLPDGNLFDENI